MNGESANFVIKGPSDLKGEIKVNGAKNAALGILIGSLLTAGKTVISNMPRIEEINRFVEIFTSVGVKMKWVKKHTLEVDVPEKLHLEKMDWEAAKKTRSVIMMMGALAKRERHFEIPFAGGCRLGKRTVKPHLFALENLGVRVKTMEDFWKVDGENLRGGEVVMFEAGDTPTENVVMAAVLAKGKSVIKFAGANYMVQDLCYFLNEMGAKIEGIGTSVLRIEGVENLEPVKYEVINDPIEAMSFVSMAATTNSEITIKGVPKMFLELELLKLSKMGWQFEILKEYLNKSGNFKLQDVLTKKSVMSASPEKLHALPFPGINMDNLPVFAPICTQACGTTLIHDWSYENRAIYLTELARLGADVRLLDIHRVEITGPTKLVGAEVMCPAALRAGMVMLIGMLAAEGESVLRNIYMVQRGYEDLPKRLRKLGAEIRVMKSVRR